MTELIVNFLFGVVTFCVNGDSSLALTLLMRRNIPYFNLRNVDGGICFTVPRRYERELAGLFGSSGLRYEIRSRRGLYFVAKRYAPRAGLIIGGLFMLFALWFSTRFVWDINVVGNSTIGDMEIIEVLEAQGCFIGAYKPSVDTYKIANEFPLKFPGVGWISVNIVGTTAEVQVVEFVAPEIPGKDGSAYDIYAARDGVIVRFMTSSGQACVGVGEAVKAGDLIVRGAYQRDDIFVPGRATGAVWARTNREFEVSVPYNYSETAAQREIIISRSLNILGKTIKIPTKKVTIDEKYGIINGRERVTLFGGLIELPIWYNKTVSTPTAEVSRTLTRTEAAEIAELKLAEQIAALPDAEVLEYKTEALSINGAYVLRARIVCVENIAVK